MAVTNCRECGETVSTQAAACPHCGAPKPARPASSPLRNVLFAVGFFIVLFWGLGQCGDTSTPVRSASTPPTPSVSPTPPPPPEPGEQWAQTIEASPIDDSRSVFLGVEGTPIPNSYGGSETPMLLIRCVENTTSVIIRWDTYLGIDARPITYRIDDEPARNQTWSISTDYESLGRWSGGSAIPLAKSLFGHEKLYARVTPYGESPVETTFDVSGLEDRIGPLREACNW